MIIAVVSVNASNANFKTTRITNEDYTIIKDEPLTITVELATQTCAFTAVGVVVEELLSSTRTAVEESSTSFVRTDFEVELGPPSAAGLLIAAVEQVAEKRELVFLFVVQRFIFIITLLAD